MSSDKTIIYREYTISEHVTEADHGDERDRISHFTIYKPNNGPELCQRATEAEAKKAVDDDIANGGK